MVDRQTQVPVQLPQDRKLQYPPSPAKKVCKTNRFLLVEIRVSIQLLQAEMESPAGIHPHQMVLDR